MTKILTGVLVLAALLTCTALSSHATCAWVLWMRESTMREGDSPVYGPWTMLGAEETARDCKLTMGALALSNRGQLKSRADITAISEPIMMPPDTTTSVVFQVRGEPYGRTLAWMCLPDTLPPQDPDRPAVSSGAPRR